MRKILTEAEKKELLGVLKEFMYKELEELVNDAESIEQIYENISSKNGNNGKKQHENAKNDNIKIKVSNYLKNLGISTNLKGYHYLREAIIMMCLSQKKISSFSTTKEIYPYVSKKFGVKPAQAERCIRHAIENCFMKGNKKEIDRLFKSSYSPEKGKATNSEFLYTIADDIKNNLK